MNKRLVILSNYIQFNEKVADIGCDHGILSLLLAKRKIYSLALDKRKNIIKATSTKFPADYKKYTEFRVSDGLRNVYEKDNISTAVFSGIGSYTIVNILKNSTLIFENIITVTNKDFEYVRKNICNRGYFIYKEEVIFEKKIFYILIHFKKGIKKHNKNDYILGINHQNNELYIKYLDNVININNDILSKHYDKELDIKNKLFIEKRSKYHL